jgi:hypothetical protein
MPRTLSHYQAAFERAPSNQNGCHSPNPPRKTDDGCLAEEHGHQAKA